jgi:hypothetical protein
MRLAKSRAKVAKEIEEKADIYKKPRTFAGKKDGGKVVESEDERWARSSA